jgi:hypothetical protein
MIHQSRADTNGTWAFTYFHFFKGAIGPFFKHLFATVIGYINEGRLELHQGVKVLINGLNAFALQWGQDFKRDQGVFCLLDVLDYFHM